MVTPAALTPTDILTLVRHWSVKERLILLQALLQTLQGDLPLTTRPPTLERALELAATDQSPPDDATIAECLTSDGRYGTTKCACASTPTWYWTCYSPASTVRRSSRRTPV